MSEFSTDEHVAESGVDVYDTWYGTELTSVPGYSEETTYVLTGGSVVLTGPGAGQVTTVWEGLREDDPSIGSRGYYIHFQQAPWAAEFEIHCTLTYEVA